jgi:hypothetical protein
LEHDIFSPEASLFEICLHDRQFDFTHPTLQTYLIRIIKTKFSGRVFCYALPLIYPLRFGLPVSGSFNLLIKTLGRLLGI